MVELKLDKVDWANQFKMRIANPDESFQKHEVVKLILLMKLIKKNRKDKNYIRIYTEFLVGNTKRKCDIYFENIKAKSVIVYEIQKQVTTDWLENIQRDYSNLEIPYFTFDYIVIKLNELSSDLERLNRQLDEYIL